MKAKAQFQPKTVSSNRWTQPAIEDTTPLLTMGYAGNGVLVSMRLKRNSDPNPDHRQAASQALAERRDRH